MGAWLAARRLNSGKFVWPADSEATRSLSRAQLDALALGLPCQRVGTAGKASNNELGLGVSAPMGSFDLSAGYRQSTRKSANSGLAAKGKDFSLGAACVLSKRTRTYTNYIDGDIVESAAGATARKYSRFALGVRKYF